MSEASELPRGFRAAGCHCGLKTDQVMDLGLIVADEAWPAFAMFTQNTLLGAHIPVCANHLKASSGLVRAVLVNSGNANCAAGDQGEADNELVCQALAERLDCPAEQILFMSTGVIGKRLDTQVIVDALAALCDSVSDGGIDEFARAIMTTDTVPKVVTGSLTGSDGDEVQVTGIAKGSGMIHPDMATLLAFLLTDGRSQADLRMGLAALADRSFHRVTVDGDTSPNDTLLLWSADRSWCRPTKSEMGEDIHPLEAELERVSIELSRKIAADGEGASRLVTIEIRGQMSETDVLDVGRFIATSPLVKTAIYGRDPNWGRILSAASSSGFAIDLRRARVWIGEHTLFENGQPLPENEAAAAAHLRDSTEVTIGVDLAMGPYSGECWTCDLTPEYIHINANYRT